MVAAATRGQATPIGREPELALVRDFLVRGDGPRALILVGGPGIGKTTLWEAGIDVAREHGVRILSTRASAAEARLSFAALVDLLDGIDLQALEGVPAPQLRALEAATLRAEPDGSPPEAGAIGLAFRNALRALAVRAHC